MVVNGRWLLNAGACLSRFDCIFKVVFKQNICILVTMCKNPPLSLIHTVCTIMFGYYLSVSLEKN